MTDRRRSERGGTLEFVIASVALVMAIAAVIVAFTRERTVERATPPSTADQSVALRVPDVVGMVEAGAIHSIAAAGLESMVSTSHNAAVPTHQVVMESPTAGSAVTRGTRVKLVVSAGP
jgi:beta-lactam-binding protein with PASTA domain